MRRDGDPPDEVSDNDSERITVGRIIRSKGRNLRAAWLRLLRG